jgi:xylan 1,4-beta-xylosidase
MAGAGRFTGTIIGMYTSSNGKESKNYADFDWFEYQKLTE